MTIHVDNGPLWVQIAIAIGTLGAALAAASAALVALRSTRASESAAKAAEIAANASAGLFQLEQERRNTERADRDAREAASLTADLRVSFERGRPSSVLVVRNYGPATATLVSFEVSPDVASRLVIHADDMPVERLAPGESIRTIVVTTGGTPTRFPVALQWTDGRGTHDSEQIVDTR